ncbi:MAG: hypothetical protein V1755_02720 [Chloroflexota bacterium]
MTRDDKGRFVPGNPGNPNSTGRPPKEREVRFYEITLSAVSFDDWKAIVNKAKEQAKRGDAVARKWLADYLIGAPVQRTELTGPEGGKLQIEVTDSRERLARLLDPLVTASSAASGPGETVE